MNTVSFKKKIPFRVATTPHLLLVYNVSIVIHKGFKSPRKLVVLVEELSN